MRNRDRYTNAKNTLNTLLAQHVIPIVNENDTVSVDEIKVGDNDTLSAHITNLVNADLLLILTSVDGFLDYDKMEVISEISTIDKRIENYIKSIKTNLGTGGMVTKINAAKIVNKCGEWMVIANGREKNIVLRILNGETLGTIFKPAEKKLASKKRWLAFNKNVKGTIEIDKGAHEALIQKGKSLLPIGVIKVDGSFEFGDLVSINYNKEEAARGLVNYSSLKLNEIKGLKTAEIVNKLGSLDYQEVIHRDNLVVLI
ncbi:glutamate 5-kinase [bacterium]|nr:glutamate 5-kinase [bacterium]